MPEPLDALNAFLTWYRDLYGTRWFIDEEEENTPARPVEASAKLPAPEVPVAPTPVGGLEDYHQHIKECQICPLGGTRTNFVFGSGNPEADIMFIGEAPGRDEDLQGLPFVGRSGQLLTRILEMAGLKREDVYIANILKCRPPNNRDTQPDEIESCSPYLHRQIELVHPKLLVALGRISAHKLLNTETPLTRLRGQIHRYRGTPLVVTFHPAYVLRNQNAMADAVGDVKGIVNLIKTL